MKRTSPMEMAVLVCIIIIIYFAAIPLSRGDDLETVTIPRVQLIAMQDKYAEMAQERDEAKYELLKLTAGTHCTASDS